MVIPPGDDHPQYTENSEILERREDRPIRQHRVRVLPKPSGFNTNTTTPISTLNRTLPMTSASPAAGLRPGVGTGTGPKIATKIPTEPRADMQWIRRNIAGFWMKVRWIRKCNLHIFLLIKSTAHSSLPCLDSWSIMISDAFNCTAWTVDIPSSGSRSPNQIKNPYLEPFHASFMSA